MWASSFLVPKEVSALAVHNGSPVVPVGLPIANYVFMVVDTDSVERGRPRLAADGAEGELWIGALGMGLGYLRRPDLTDRAYVKNPFGRGTVYRTGDLVRRLDGGRGPYHFVRRIDNQVTRRDASSPMPLPHASPSRLSHASPSTTRSRWTASASS